MPSEKCVSYIMTEQVTLRYNDEDVTLRCIFIVLAHS
jgi:hypothetical protein